MRQRTILLVEDHPDSRHIYRVMLVHSGFRVLEALDGREAVDLARSQRPDLIVMDLGLPYRDGWEATAAIKRDRQTAEIPVIAISVHVRPEDRSRALRSGCDGFLEKPCPPQRLRREIARYLEDAG